MLCFYMGAPTESFISILAVGSHLYRKMDFYSNYFPDC